MCALMKFDECWDDANLWSCICWLIYYMDDVIILMWS